MTIVLLAAATALAGSGGVGEALSWRVYYLGMHVGDARVDVLPGPDGAWLIQGSSRSAPWYSRIYSVDDRTVSTWIPGVGSARYQTTSREGDFHQDQDMRIDPAGITVSRRQRYEEGWREWEDRYEGPGYPLEDPVTAFYHLRRLELSEGSTYSIPLFSGKRVTSVEVDVEGREVLGSALLGEVPVVRVRISSSREDELKGKGRIWVWLSDDEQRVPIQVVWKSKAIGSVRAELQDIEPGGRASD